TLKQTHQVVEKHRRQQNEAASKKEYDALKHEIDAEKAKCSQLEDEILEAMTKVEEETARIPELEKALKAGKEDYIRSEKAAQARGASLTAELHKAQGQIKEVEAGLPDDFRPQYERLVTAMGEDALSLIRDRTCSACYTSLTIQNYNDLLAGRLV